MNLFGINAGFLFYFLGFKVFEVAQTFSRSGQVGTFFAGPGRGKGGVQLLMEGGYRCASPVYIGTFCIPVYIGVLFRVYILGDTISE